MNTETMLTEALRGIVSSLYGAAAAEGLTLQKTRREFEGDYTLVVFPVVRHSRTSPAATAEAIGRRLVEERTEVARYNVVGGFLNILLTEAHWGACFATMAATPDPGAGAPTGRTVMVEFSSPNTNKPLHLGHIRNNLLGWSVSRILEAAGHRVIKANLVNDRGIHICKSMLAWQRYGNGCTPTSSGRKGDHLVGDYYVEFDRRYKAEVAALTAAGTTEEEAKRNAPIMKDAQEMLRLWEAHDEPTYALWERMNSWVYEGFEETYRALGIRFDRIYYESQTYLLGKSLVEEGLRKGVFYRRDDGSVWIDLREDGLDEKLLLRSDGTSVYMTQDLGTAYRRFDEERLDAMIYVVGNEQNYHFQVLRLILGKLGYAWSEHIVHLSYGMVELPEGKMKSREGTVVDADELVADMIRTAREIAEQQGKTEDTSEDEAAEVARKVGLGALKYFILKVDPKKTMLFDPRESIDFNGNTGPFLQYTHARIRSILRKAAQAGIDANAAADPAAWQPAETELVKLLADYPGAVQAAAEGFAPSLVAQYLYDLSRLFNSYYHDHSILREEQPALRLVRLQLAAEVARVLRLGADLLGIEMPERM